MLTTSTFSSRLGMVKQVHSWEWLSKFPRSERLPRENAQCKHGELRTSSDTAAGHSFRAKQHLAENLLLSLTEGQTLWGSTTWKRCNAQQEPNCASVCTVGFELRTQQLQPFRAPHVFVQQRGLDSLCNAYVPVVNRPQQKGLNTHKDIWHAYPRFMVKAASSLFSEKQQPMAKKLAPNVLVDCRCGEISVACLELMPVWSEHVIPRCRVFWTWENDQPLGINLEAFCCRSIFCFMLRKVPRQGNRSLALGIPSVSQQPKSFDHAEAAWKQAELWMTMTSGHLRGQQTEFPKWLSCSVLVAICWIHQKPSGKKVNWLTPHCQSLQ